VDVVKLHDGFTLNEGRFLCVDAEATALVDGDDNTRGGRYVLNPSGGLVSMDYPSGGYTLARRKIQSARAYGIRTPIGEAPAAL
jgi:hypothetical protein